MVLSAPDRVTHKRTPFPRLADAKYCHGSTAKKEAQFSGRMIFSLKQKKTEELLNFSFSPLFVTLSGGNGSITD